MKKIINRYFIIGIILLFLFVLWTILVFSVDKEPIGPENSVVGFARLNGSFHQLTGVNMTLYTITDWLGLVPVLLCFGFGILGLIQWIQRKSIKQVDGDVLLLGGFYIVVMLAYVGFEELALNYRPVLIEGRLEASYPSSTTLLVLCVMPTSFFQLNRRIKSRLCRNTVSALIIAFSLFMVAGRAVSGVHWITDIVGSVLLCGGLVTLYISGCRSIEMTQFNLNK